MAKRNKYMGLIGRLEKKIAFMEENALLPPEQQLADEFEVSKPTLRRALREMADSGRIRKINGVGITVVRPSRVISRELILLCNDITFFAETLKHAGIRSLDSNYFISIVPLSGDAKTQERIITSVAERAPSGVVIHADPSQSDLPAFHQFALKGIPTLFLVRLPRGIETNLLEFNTSETVSKIVETFYKEGCRKIAFYSPPLHNRSASKERENGYLAGMKKCRLKTRSEFFCPHEASSGERKKFIKLFKDENSRPDAVCCVNDRAAGQLIKELLKQKINIDGIRFSGFDYTGLSDFIPVPLLTVDPPFAEWGKCAVDILIKQIENPDIGFQRKKLKAKIISTRP
jgi:DNA-binding LacI/PurR family transcriptional regulator